MTKKHNMFIKFKTEKCKSCDGKGFNREQVSYYDSADVKCSFCSGYGNVIAESKVLQDVKEPFPKATD